MIFFYIVTTLFEPDLHKSVIKCFSYVGKSFLATKTIFGRQKAAEAPTTNTIIKYNITFIALQITFQKSITCTQQLSGKLEIVIPIEKNNKKTK